MRVLQVMAGAEKGGAETAFVDMVIALKKAGLEQHVATRPNDLRVSRLAGEQIPVTLLPFGGVFDLYTPWRISRLIQSIKPDIVQTWMSRAASKTPPCPKNARHPYLKICRLGGYYKLKYFKGADYFITITPDIKRHLIDLGVPSDRIFHINNFADVDEPKASFDRARFKTPEGVPLLVTLGRLHQAKGFDTLLQALAQCPGAHLWIGGDGPDRDKLEKRAHQLNLSDRVRFLGWITDRSAFLRVGNMCVFPSRYEPFGTVFVQAWAQKIPLITSDADGPRQYVRPYIDGLVFPVDDVDELARCIQTLIDHPDKGVELARAGYLRYQNEFTREKTVRDYSDLYRSLLSLWSLTSQPDPLCSRDAA